MSRSPTNQSPGLQAWIWPIALIAIGVYRLHHANYSPLAHVGNIALIVFGAIVLALAALATSARNNANPSVAAQRVARQQKALFGGLHEFRDASDADFLPLDRAFYDAATTDL